MGLQENVLLLHFYKKKPIRSAAGRRNPAGSRQLAFEPHDPKQVFGLQISQCTKLAYPKPRGHLPDP